MFYVYILKNKSEIYIGYTSDLRRRLAEHNAGKTKSTKGRDWKILYYEAHTEQEDAKRRESYLKTSQGKQALHRMLRAALSKS